MQPKMKLTERRKFTVNEKEFLPHDEDFMNDSTESTFSVQLTTDIFVQGNELILENGETFEVYPSILRFNESVYEVASGFAKGFMLHVDDCIQVRH